MLRWAKQSAIEKIAKINILAYLHNCDDVISAAIINLYLHCLTYSVDMFYETNQTLQEYKKFIAFNKEWPLSLCKIQTHLACILGLCDLSEFNLIFNELCALFMHGTPPFQINTPFHFPLQIGYIQMTSTLHQTKTRKENKCRSKQHRQTRNIHTFEIVNWSS